MLVGGILFAGMSIAAAKYNGRQQKSTAIAQDFLSGSILIALLGAIMPDYFPQFPIDAKDLMQLSASVGGAVGGGNDIDLQLGPLGAGKYGY
jgi:hypothetical protein